MNLLQGRLEVKFKTALFLNKWYSRFEQCDEIAIQACKMNTLDCLKKPVTDNRMLKMSDKTRE